MKRMTKWFSLCAAFLMVFVCLAATGCTEKPVPTAPATETEQPTAPATEAPVTSEPPVTTEQPVTSEQPVTNEPTSGADKTTAATEDKPTTAKPTTKAPTTKVTTQSVSTTADWTKNYRSRQILNDNTFQNGFSILDQVTTKPEGVWHNTSSTKEPSWQLAQWGTYYSYVDRSGFISLFRDNISKVKNIIDTGMSRVEYNDKAKSLTLSINTFKYFDGHGHTDNSSWPHLLIQQNFIDRKVLNEMEDEDMAFYTGAADKMILKLDLRMTKFRHEMYDGINACQLVSFYAISSLRDTNFIWFSVPLFDDRGYNPGESKAKFVMDKGTNSYMYGIPQVEIYDHTDIYGRYDFLDEDGRPSPSEDWLSIEIDLKPYFEEMASRSLKGTEYNVYKAKTIDQLYFSGMNLGYEIHGSYDVSFEIKNYSLTTYVAKNKK